MCIVAIKPAGVQKPTQEQFDAMCTANSSGFGFMTWSKEKGLQVRKTMNKEQYIRWVNKIPDEQPVVYHMRIPTHGSVQAKNCHPFMDATKHWAFAHNGVLSISNEGDMTDSETFFKRVAMPFIYAGMLPNSKPFDKMINAIIGSSKFAFMNDKGEIFKYGNFIKEGDLFFSNDSYKPRQQVAWGCGSLSPGKYGGHYWGYYGGCDYDDYRLPISSETLGHTTQTVGEVITSLTDKDKEYEPTDSEMEELMDFLIDQDNNDFFFRSRSIEGITELSKAAFPWVTKSHVKEVLHDWLGIDVKSQTALVEC